MREDEHGRLTAQKHSFTKTIVLNPEHITAVKSLPSQIVEGAGNAAVQLSKLVTLAGESVVVVGSQLELERKIFGDTREILKG